MAEDLEYEFWLEGLPHEGTSEMYSEVLHRILLEVDLPSWSCEITDGLISLRINTCHPFLTIVQ